MKDEHPLTSRAFLLAGSSAHLSYRDIEAQRYFAKARVLAPTDDDRWEAIRGEVLAAAMLEDLRAEELLRSLEAMNDGRVDRETAFTTVRYSTGTRLGTGSADPAPLERLAHLSDRLRNPIHRTGFLYLLAQGLVYAGRYREALSRIAACATLAEDERLPFLKPYVSLIRAQAEYGQRNFGRAMRLLHGGERITTASSDSWFRTETLVVKAHIYLAEGLPEKAIEALEDVHAYSPAPGELGECYLAEALARSLLGDAAAAAALCDRAQALTRAVHVKALAPCVLAIVAAIEGNETELALIHRAYDAIRTTGDVNAFVCAYRAFPSLLRPAMKEESIRHWLIRILRHARDDHIAAHLGMRLKRKSGGGLEILTKRELEVLELLAQGLTNPQIAKALWISESTTKVHLRHIFEKLSVRTRVEAAMKAAALKGP